MSDKFKYPYGALVEVIDTGVRLFVVDRYFDENNIALYALSPKKDGVFTLYGSESNEVELGGYTESNLCITKLEDISKNPMERDYIVIEVDKKREGDIGRNLQQNVGAWMKKGFVPSGSVFTTDKMIFQPMMKKVKL